MAVPVRFVLVRVRNSLNIGAAARAMANFGFDDLAAVEPFEPRWREAASAVHGADILAKAPVVTLEQAVADRHLVLGTASHGGRSLRIPVVDLPALGGYLDEHLPPGGRVAVLFGSEKTGLSNAELGLCSALLRIPTRPEAASMNLGQAVACVAGELARPKASARTPSKEGPAPDAAQREALISLVMAAMAKAGYKRHMPEATRRVFLRRALDRWALTRGDASFLQGLLKRLV